MHRPGTFSTWLGMAVTDDVDAQTDDLNVEGSVGGVMRHWIRQRHCRHQCWVELGTRVSRKPKVYLSKAFFSASYIPGRAK